MMAIREMAAPQRTSRSSRHILVGGSASINWMAVPHDKLPLISYTRIIEKNGRMKDDNLDFVANRWL